MSTDALAGTIGAVKSRSSITAPPYPANFPNVSDLDQTRSFLHALGGWSGPAHTFQTFGDSKSNKADSSLRRILNGTLADHGAELARLNKNGAGVFVTINRTDLSGRKEANIIEPRAVFIDFDGPAGRGVGARPVSMIVRSVAGPHLYWLLESGQSLGTWTKVQKAIARRYGGDVACHDPPRVMRLPGFDHHKAEARAVGLDAAYHPDRRYTLDEIIHAYALDLSEPKPKPKPIRQHDLSNRQKRCRAFLDVCSPAVEGQGGWAYTKGICGIGGDFGLETHEFMPLLLEWNARCDPPWDDVDLQKKLDVVHAKRTDPFGFRLDEDRGWTPKHSGRMPEPPPPEDPPPDLGQKTSRRPDAPMPEPPPGWEEGSHGSAARQPEPPMLEPPDGWEESAPELGDRFAVGGQPDTESPGDDSSDADPRGDDPTPPQGRKVSELRSTKQLKESTAALMAAIGADPDVVFEPKNLLLLAELQRRKRRLFQATWRALGEMRPKVPLQDLRQAITQAAPPRRPPQDGDGGGGAERGPERLILNPDYPHDSAILFVRRRSVIRSHLRVFFEYEGHRYVEQPAENMDKAVREFGKSGWQWDAKDKDYVPFKADTRKTNEIIAAMHAERLVRRDRDVPGWMCDRCGVPCRCHDDKPPGDEITPCRNGLLHLPTKRLLASTSDFFATHCVEADYNRAAPCLVWMEFLYDLFGDDLETVALLQEFMGYLLTQDTSMQKALLMIGPPRSGKGTISSVMKALVGEGNYCSPSLGDFATQFGMQTFIGKSLAVVPDASLTGRSDGAQIAERLRAITGEDSVQIDRKGIAPVDAQLRTRIVLSTNETPKWNDATGALQERFMVIRMTKTFLNREDRTLRGRILEELSGILNWACDGWERLQERGHFKQPSRSKAVVHEMIGLGAPVASFVEEHCIVGDGSERLDALFNAWKDWCEENGYDRPGSKPQFGKNLAQIIPTLEKARVSDDKGKRRFVYSGVRLRTELEP